MAPADSPVDMGRRRLCKQRLANPSERRLETENRRPTCDSYDRPREASAESSPAQASLGVHGRCVPEVSERRSSDLRTAAPRIPEASAQGARSEGAPAYVSPHVYIARHFVWHSCRGRTEYCGPCRRRHPESLHAHRRQPEAIRDTAFRKCIGRLAAFPVNGREKRRKTCY